MRNIFGLVVFVLLFHLGHAQIENNNKIDCVPDSGIGVEPSICLGRGCIYEEVLDQPGVPWCYFPENYGYSMDGAPVETPAGMTVSLVRNAGSVSFLGGDFDYLTLEAEFQTPERLRIKITPVGETRFKVPISISGTGSKPPDTLYSLTFSQSSSGLFGFQVIRTSTGSVLFDSDLPGFIYSEQFLQIATKLPQDSGLYGLGENEQHTYRHDMNWKTWVGYARGHPPEYDANMYGVHPTYTLLESDGNAHTVLFLNSAAQEWAITPQPAFVYRTIGGILDMYFFLGPSPSDANSQYSEAVGRHPLPPYWSLGFHLCKYGYNNLENMIETVDRHASYNIPQDAQWGDIDIMDRRLDFTYSLEFYDGLPEFVRELKTRGIKFVTILDPGISTGEGDGYRPYQLGNEMDVWVKKSDGITNVVGEVWPDDPVFWPDYSKQETKDWWQTLIVEFHDVLEFDALWIDMNEPESFINGDLNDGCADNTINYPPYKTKAVGAELSENTLCGDHVQSHGSHYDTHSLYGWSQTEATLLGVQQATGQRGWVLSRSTFVGSGKWAAHWLGDNYSNWENMAYSIIGMLQFNRFAIPNVGADICGFIGFTAEEMCARWHLLGAFYPFSRNHHGHFTNQDPGWYGPEFAELARNVLNMRYRFLPYLYTLFYQHYSQGTSVARALWDEFPTDNLAWTVDTQFLWGSGLMISPVLQQGAVSRDVYFPDARWFEITHWLTMGTILEVSWRNTNVTVDAPLAVLPLHIRGGVTFPLQLEAVNTELSRQNPWIILVALDDDETSQGEIYMDDGVSMGTVESGQYFRATFAATSTALTSTIVTNGYPGMTGQFIETFEIVGLTAATITNVVVNGVTTTAFTYTNGRLSIGPVSVMMAQEFVVTYE